MQPRLIISFERLSDPDFMALAELVSSSLAGNASFPEPYPPQVPGLAQIAADLATLTAAYNAAKGGDRGKIAMRVAARETLSAELKKLAHYLEVVAAGDAALLMTTGFQLRRDIVRTSAGNGEVLPAPEGFSVTRGELSGTVVAHARRLAGAGSYQVQMAVSDPTVETNWSDGGTFMRCSRIELKGLSTGKTISVRLRGIGTHSPGVWTPAVSIMVA